MAAIQQLLASYGSVGILTGTVSLLHFEGADTSTTFTDDVGNSWTAGGNAQIDTAQFKFGSASGLFDGTGDYIATPMQLSLQPGTGDFTVEAFVRPNVASGTMNVFSTRESGSGITLRLVSSNQLDFFAGAGTDRIFSPGSISTGAWTHVALTRQGTTTRIFIAGVVANTGTCSANLDSLNTNMHVGAFRTAGGTVTESFNGWIDEFRYTTGLARYTANFTPPAAPFSYP